MHNEKIQNDIFIVGAGIAGLTAALAFAAHHRNVTVFEKAPILKELGAGLQISPNAYRILDHLGVINFLSSHISMPDSVVLLETQNLKQLTRMPVKKFASSRWGAPYITLLRADLQSALMQATQQHNRIKILTKHELTSFKRDHNNIRLQIKNNEGVQYFTGNFLVGADGIHSHVKQSIDLNSKPVFTKNIAWRTTIPASAPLLKHVFQSFASLDDINIFMAPQFHLVTYPISAGKLINLVAFTENSIIPPIFDICMLEKKGYGLSLPLKEFIQSIPSWIPWPLYIRPASYSRNLSPHVAVIGDAAHAMLPFGAQGASMAIEDAFTLAETLGTNESSNYCLSELEKWQNIRHKRVAKVRFRSQINGIVWNAEGLLALSRNLCFTTISPERLLSSLDWLYGWHPTSLSKKK